MLKKNITLFLVLIFLIFLTSCTGDYNAKDNTVSDENSIKEEEIIEEEQLKEEENKEHQQKNVTGLIPNENGQVMILMYHRIGDEESTWTRSKENFIKDLNKLYDKGYRLISLNDYLDNKIDVPLGTTPVILTFDDGTAGQFDFIKDEETLKIDPDSAVGILHSFYDEHPDFGLEATFYVNDMPFNKKYWKDAVRTIVDLGMDIGNHTLTHENLKKINSDRYPRQLGGLVFNLCEVLPDYKINTLALPFGACPGDITKVVKGEYKGLKYENKAILLVGARPAPAPDDSELDTLKLPRIRADEENFNRWIDYFDEHPEKRYVSDGIL